MKGNSGFILICSRGVDPSLNLQVGTQGSSRVSAEKLGVSRVASGNSGSSRVVAGNLGFHASCHGDLGFPFMLGWYSGFLTCSGASSHVVLGQLISSRDVQGGSCLVAMFQGYSLLLAWDFSIFVVGFNSVVVVGLILSIGGVKSPHYLWCEVHLC